MIMICTKGYMRFQCNLQERTVKAGEVMILFPNSIGECLDTSPDFQVALIACLDDSYAGEASASFSAKFRNRLAQQMIISLTREQMDEMLFLYRLMRKKMEAPCTEFTREALKGCMQVILAECYQEVSKEQEIKDTKDVRNRSKRLFDTFLNLVQRYYTHERSITFYASEMCLTPKYLAQVIYQESGRHGRHAGEWIKDCVILEAKALLKSGKYTAQQVSDMLNFANASFFGKSPTLLSSGNISRRRWDARPSNIRKVSIHKKNGYANSEPHSRVRLFMWKIFRYFVSQMQMRLFGKNLAAI